MHLLLNLIGHSTLTPGVIPELLQAITVSGTWGALWPGALPNAIGRDHSFPWNAEF